MRAFLNCHFIALTLVAAPSFARADSITHPLQFAKGKGAQTIEGSHSGGQTIEYTLRAAAGQTMSIKLSGGSSF
jgi:nitrous oxidase accessory protein NosD